MSKYIIRLFCFIFIFSFIFNSIKVESIKLNDYRFFLRISEKYDNEIKIQWQRAIKERMEILNYIKINNKNEEYNKYINDNKKILRIERKYKYKLNNSIEDLNEDKIKRYLKLILNIFEDENDNLRKYFNMD